MLKTVSFSPINLILIVFVTGPLIGTFFPVETYLSGQSAANPLGGGVAPTIATSLVLMLMYAVIILLSLTHSQAMLDGMTRNWFLLAFAGWAIVTALWAETPSASFNRSGRLLLSILYAIYLARVCDRRTMFRILLFSTLLGILGSALVTGLLPNYSRVLDARGAYRGAFQHKNVLGSVAALALILGCYGYQVNLTGRRICVALIVLSLVFLALANSVTAIVAMLLGGSLALYLRTFGGKPGPDRLLAMLVGLIAIGGAYSVFAFFPQVLDFTGRDLTTLTGRTDVWHFAQIMIDMKPIWGWGHGAWASPMFTEFALKEIAWAAPHAHNAWLDFRLQLGVPGLALGILCAFFGIKRAFSTIMVSRDGEYLVWVTVIVFQGIRSGTETMFVDPASIEMFWFSLAVVRLGVLASQSKQIPTALRRGAHRLSPSFAGFGSRSGTGIDDGYAAEHRAVRSGSSIDVQDRS